MAISLLILAKPSLWAGLSLAQTRAAPSGPSAYQPDGRHRTFSAAMAIAMAGGVFGVLATALVQPTLIPDIIGTTDVHQIPADPPEAPPVPRPEPQQTQSHLTAPLPLRPSSGPTNDVRLTDPFDTLPPIGPVIGTGPMVIEPVFHPPIPPLYVGPRRRLGFERAFQPPYPAAAQREGIEGSCPVNVTIAANGRATAVRDRGCTAPSFFAATQRQALARWRFEPATRGGVAVESAMDLNVRFRIEQ